VMASGAGLAPVVSMWPGPRITGVQIHQLRVLRLLGPSLPCETCHSSAQTMHDSSSLARTNTCDAPAQVSWAEVQDTKDGT
jgi:hypothetical protein